MSLATDIVLDDNAPLLNDKIVGANDGLKNSIFFTMTIVSISCNIFTLVLSYFMIYNLALTMKAAKRNREKKRRRLYFYSILFVSLNFA